MPNVLILGTGQVGTFISRAIAEISDFSIVAADLQPAPGYYARFGPKNNYKLVTVDILDCHAIQALLEEHQFDAVVLSAGLVGTACNRDTKKALEVNVRGNQIVAEYAIRTGVKRIVFISSFSVYGRPTAERITELETTHPISEYGKTKIAAEQALTPFHDQGLDVRILRACGTYGPLRLGMGSHSARFIESVLFCLRNGKKLTIKATQNTSDEYLYIKDLARAAAFATLRDTSSNEFVFNVGSGVKTTAESLRLAVQQIVPGVQVDIQDEDASFIPSMPPLDISRIKEVFGFEPHYNLIEGLTDYLQEANLKL